MAVDIKTPINRAFREFRRYSGDGLANEPTGAPLPIGDPNSGQHNPAKREIRDAFTDIDGPLNDAIDAVETARDETEGFRDEARDQVASVMPTVSRFAVGGAVQSVDLGNPALVPAALRVFIDGVYQFSDTWDLTEGVLTPADAWPGDGLTENMEIIVDAAVAIAVMVPSTGSVTESSLAPNSVTPPKIKTGADFGGAISQTVWPSGTLRTLRARARDVYNLADAPGSPDPTGNNASTAALIAMLAEGVKCEIPKGDWVTEEELEIVTPGQVIEFLNAGGYGYGANADALPNWQPNTRIIASGAFAKRIRTRRLFRANASDPQDAALSAVINVQADGAILMNPCVWLDCDYSNTSHTNLGDDVDIGIFVGTRVGVQMHNAQIIGYFRRAGLYVDVSGTDNAPRMLDKSGDPYPMGSVPHGADGFHLFNPYIRGGRVGLALLGAKPKSGESDYSDPYYDQQTGGTVTDNRGRFGASDFAVFGGRIYGPDHHSGRRLKDPELDGGVLSLTSMLNEPDDAPAAVHIDGLAGNASTSLQGIGFYGTRIATIEAFRLRLGKGNRVGLTRSHIEGRSATNASGGSINVNDVETVSYGHIAANDQTGFAWWKGSASTSLSNAAAPHFYGSRFTLESDAGDYFVAGDLTYDGILRSGSGEFDARAAEGNGARFRNGNATIGVIPPGGIHGTTTGNAANVFVGSGNELLRSTSAAAYKTGMKPLEDTALDAFMQLDGISYLSLCEADDPQRRFSGFLADQAHELGLQDLVHYGAEGEVVGFAYERATAYLLEIIKRRLAGEPQ
jgi:hypothetical protein